MPYETKTIEYHAQPTTLAHHLCAHESALGRDFDRIQDAYSRVNLCPLGAAAFASTGFNLNRKRIQELLGFDGLLENSMDAVSTRDFLIECASGFTNLMLVGMTFLLIYTYSKLGGVVEAHQALTNMANLVPQALADQGHRGWTAMPAFNSPIWWTMVSTIVMGVGIGALAQPQLAVRFMFMPMFYLDTIFLFIILQ